MSDHGHFPSYERAIRSGERVRFAGLFVLGLSLGLFFFFFFSVSYFGLACEHGNLFLCLEEE